MQINVIYWELINLGQVNISNAAQLNHIPVYLSKVKFYWEQLLYIFNLDL